MLSNTGQLALIVAVIYIIIFFLLGSGLFNSIIERPNVSNSTFIVPSRSVQTIGETMVTTMILFIGMAGAFLLYRSGKAVNPKTQGGLLVAGFATMGIALILGFRLVGIKAWVEITQSVGRHVLEEKDRLEGMYEWEKCKAKIDGVRCFCGGSPFSSYQ